MAKLGGVWRFYQRFKGVTGLKATPTVADNQSPQKKWGLSLGFRNHRNRCHSLKEQDRTQFRANWMSISRDIYILHILRFKYLAPAKISADKQPPSQALVSVFMQVPNWDISLANATESLGQNNTATVISGHNLGSRSIKSSRLAVATLARTTIIFKSID